MVTLIGIILLALGVSLAVVWQTSVLGVLMGIIPLTLIFWGGLVVLIGYAEMKARREYRDAVDDSDSSTAPADSPRDARGSRGRNARNHGAAVTPSASTASPVSPNTPPASTAQPSPPNHST